MNTVIVMLALLGAALIAVGVGLIFLPAGVIVGGIELVAAAYVIRYLEAQHEDSPAPRP